MNNVIEQHNKMLEKAIKMRFNNKKRTLRLIKMHRGGKRYESKNARKARKKAVQEHARMKRMMSEMAKPLLRAVFPASMLNNLISVQPLPKKTAIQEWPR